MKQTSKTHQDVEGGAEDGKGSRLGDRTQYPLRLPGEMHKDFQGFAEEDGVTLHAYFMKVLTEHWRRRKQRKNKE